MNLTSKNGKKQKFIHESRCLLAVLAIASDPNGFPNGFKIPGKFLSCGGAA